MKMLMQREKESQKMLEEAFKGIGYHIYPLADSADFTDFSFCAIRVISEKDLAALCGSKSR